MGNRKIVLYIFLLVIVTIAAYILFVVIPSRLAERSYEGARNIARDIRKAFQFNPEVKVNNTVILQQQEDILELALVSQTFRHEYEWTNTWMGSTKKIAITGTFEAKAGFDLEKKFSMDIRKDKIIFTLPRARMLSVTPRHDITFRDENGIWNWVNMEDRTKAINAFTRNAMNTVETTRFVTQAEGELEKRLTEIGALHGKEVVFVYEDLPEKIQERR